MQLKIALFISGHLRSIEYTLSNILELKNELNCDIYLHTWTSAEMGESTWRRPDLYEINNLDIERYVKALNPINYLIEHQPPQIYEEREFSGIGFMIYGMKRAYDLVPVENLEKYNVAIRYRFDICCHNVGDIKKDTNKVFMNPDYVVMPTHNWGECLGVNSDCVIISSFSTYKIILDKLWELIPNLYNKFNFDIDKFFPELMINQTITRIKKIIISSESGFSLIRSGGREEQKFSKKSIFRFSFMRSCFKSYTLVRKIKTKNSAVKVAWNRNSWPIKSFTIIFHPLYRMLFE